ncbi:MAG: excisionase family DNA-binding protein [Deltaproteobacteria bacterium]|nr:excisionase family DNA-binding protein [Deltaproteobacteria bacterium]
MEKTLFSTTEVAGWLGVFHTTARRWIERGKIKGIRVGRNYKVPVEEAIRVLNYYKVPLPGPLKTYELKKTGQVNGPSFYKGGSNSILQKLLLVEEIEDPAFACRQDAILGANQAFCRLLGYSQVDMIGLDVGKVLDKTTKSKLIEFAQEQQTSPGKGAADYEGYLKGKENTTNKARITIGSLDRIKGVFLLVIKN